MLLAIDIGNTSTSIGLFQESRISNHWRTETKKESTADRLALLFREFLQMAGLEFNQVKGIVISNVVPSLQHAVTSMSKRYFGIEPLSVNYTNVGIEIEYPNPSEIGSDRLVNAVAARYKYKGPAIIVDFGTATTFDYVNESGAYCGGVITPGIAISNEALYRWTSKLPRVDIGKTENILAKSTTSAIQSGVYHGYKGMVESLIEKLKREVGGKPKVVATGGLASLVVGDSGVLVDKFLTLDGLQIVFNDVALGGAEKGRAR